MSDLSRLFEKNYVPGDQDILRARLRTTGISETIFDTGNLTFKMFDVGGQRSERKKWIHVFDNVQVVLFLVAVSGFDHVLVEDKNGVRHRNHFLNVVNYMLTVHAEPNARGFDAFRIHCQQSLL
jgi:hypothetical protein